jgi:hypothetical protein
MKVRSLLAAALFVTTTAFAQTEKKIDTKKTQVPVFNQVNIDVPIEVVLVEGNDPGVIYLVGDARLFDDLNLDVKNEELRISAKKIVNYKSKLTVEVHVKNLEKLTVQKEALVFSGNTLQSKKVNVYIAGGSKASLVSTGLIFIYSEDESELVFLRKTAGVTVENR